MSDEEISEHECRDCKHWPSPSVAPWERYHCPVKDVVITCEGSCSHWQPCDEDDLLAWLEVGGC